jgi:Ca2+-transporting ATPase
MYDGPFLTASYGGSDLLQFPSPLLHPFLRFAESWPLFPSQRFSFHLSHYNMDYGTRPEIPSIVTEDLSSTPAIHVDSHYENVSLTLPTTSSHSRRPSNLTLLSPGILKPGRRSFDTSSDEDESRLPPPSPTLSTQSSVHFITSTALRENKPGDGTTSLTLLSPKDNSFSLSRRPSNASASTDEGTVADHSPGFSQSSHLHPATSNMTFSVRSSADTLNSPTPTHVGSTSDIGDPGERRRKHKKARKVKCTEKTPVVEEGEEEDKQMELDLTQDENIDPTPFAFKPYHLASLVDPKSLETLEAMGGAKSLLAGLGVDPTNGLSIGGNKPESGNAAGVVVATPGGEKGDVGTKSTHEGAAYAGTVEDRQMIYGSNVLPARKSKSFWELMWFALKDRTLVSSLISTSTKSVVNVCPTTDPPIYRCGHLPGPRLLPGLRSRLGTRKISS